MSSEILYEVNFQPWDASWLLSGPVGANGKLLFASARDAVSHARWAAKANGGTITVFDPQGKLFKTIDVVPDTGSDDHFILPNSDWPLPNSGIESRSTSQMTKP